MNIFVMSIENVNIFTSILRNLDKFYGFFKNRHIQILDSLLVHF